MRYFGVHALAADAAPGRDAGRDRPVPGVVRPDHQPEAVAEAAQRRARADADQLGVITDADYVKAAATPIKTTLQADRRRRTAARSRSRRTSATTCSSTSRATRSSGKTATDRADVPDRGGYTIRTTLDVKAQESAQKTLDKKVPITDKHGAAVCGDPAGHRQHPGDGPEPDLGHRQGQPVHDVQLQRRPAHQPDATGQQIATTASASRPGRRSSCSCSRPRSSSSIPVNTRIHAPVSYIPNKGFKDCEGHDASANTPIFNDEGGSGTYDLRTGTWDVGQHLLRAAGAADRPVRAGEDRRSRWASVRADGGTVPGDAVDDARRQPGRPASTWPRRTPPSPRTARTARRARSCRSRRRPARPSRCRRRRASRSSTPRSPTASPRSSRASSTFGTGRTEQAQAGRPAAGKTGTTDEHVNVWFCGFTPQLAAAVWVGDPTGAGVGKKWCDVERQDRRHARTRPAFGYNLPRAGVEGRHGPTCPGTAGPAVRQDRPVGDPRVHHEGARRHGHDRGQGARRRWPTRASPRCSAAKPVDSLLPAGIVVQDQPEGRLASSARGSTITVYVSSGKPPPAPAPQPDRHRRPAPPTPPPPGGGDAGGGRRERWPGTAVPVRAGGSTASASQAELAAHLGGDPAALGGGADLRPHDLHDRPPSPCGPSAPLARAWPRPRRRSP